MKYSKPSTSFPSLKLCLALLPYRKTLPILLLNLFQQMFSEISEEVLVWCGIVGVEGVSDLISEVLGEGLPKTNTERENNGEAKREELLKIL